MQLTHVTDRLARESASFSLGAVRVTEQFLPGDGPVRKKDLSRLRDQVAHTVSGLNWLGSSGTRMVGIGGAVRNLAAAAQAAGAALDLGVQGFVITPKVLSRPDDRAGPRCPCRSAAWCPGSSQAGATSSSPPPVVLDTVVEVGGFAGIEATEAGLREGVFLALHPARPRAAPVRRRPRRRRAQPRRPVRVGAWPTSSTSPSSRCRCSTRWWAPAAVHPRRRRARAALGRLDAPRRRHDHLV